MRKLARSCLFEIYNTFPAFLISFFCCTVFLPIHLFPSRMYRCTVRKTRTGEGGGGSSIILHEFSQLPLLLLRHPRRLLLHRRRGRGLEQICNVAQRTNVCLIRV